VRKIQDLHKFDCLRANKSTMAWGVEARVPFLDRDFLATAMAIDPAEKMIDKSKCERWIALCVIGEVVHVGGWVGGDDCFDREMIDLERANVSTWIG
jgi:hypothetical protein